MDREQIIESVKMDDILSKYGLKKNRKGFMCCPFHSEKSPSMKIYDKSFYCFGCGTGGDVFSFVMLYENIPFRDAFLSLGGTYADSKETRFDRMHRKRDIKAIQYRNRRKEEENRKKITRIQAVSSDIDDLSHSIKNMEPLSSQWCDATNKREKLLIEYERLRKEVMDKE